MVRALTDLERGTIVVLPSATFPDSELRKIVAIQHYEERLLCTTLLLANPDIEIVYITSLPVDEAIVEYYLRFVPDAADARRRLHLVVVGEDSGRALSAKVLDAPHVVDRVRSLVDGVELAYVLPFNVTALEGRFAELVGLPIFGAAPALANLGSKTESRRAARKAGVAVLDGDEDLRSVAELDAAIEGLRARRPDARAAVMKLNDGFSGQGHAIVELDGFSSLDTAAITFIAEEESWPSYSAKVESGGAVVEELIRVPGLVSPSVQLRISPAGAVTVVSNHDQILGGLHDQVYLGCRFPARAEYRLDIQERARRVGEVLAADGVIGTFGIDFVLVPDDGRYDIRLSEINLRMGGTTHPFWMARLVTGGAYDPSTGQLVADGRAKSYVASDNIKSPALVGRTPADVIAEVDSRGLGFDRTRGTGATLHLLGAVPGFGKMGMTCIADSPEDAQAHYQELSAVLVGSQPSVP
jgi:biotin carboxylase